MTRPKQQKARAQARRVREAAPVRAPLALPPGEAGYAAGEAQGPRIDGKWILQTLGVPMLQMGGAMMLANAIIKAVTSGREVTITIGPPRAVGASAGVELRTSGGEGDDHGEASVDEEKIEGGGGSDGG